MQTHEQADGFARTLGDVDAADDAAARPPSRSPGPAARPQQRAGATRSPRDTDDDRHPGPDAASDRAPSGEQPKTRKEDARPTSRDARPHQGEQARRRTAAADGPQAEHASPSAVTADAGPAPAAPQSDAVAADAPASAPADTAQEGDKATDGSDDDAGSQAGAQGAAAALAAALPAPSAAAPLPVIMPPPLQAAAAEAAPPPAGAARSGGVSGIAAAASATGTPAVAPAAGGASGASPAGKGTPAEADAVQATPRPDAGSPEQAHPDDAAGTPADPADRGQESTPVAALPAVPAEPKDTPAAADGHVVLHARRTEGAALQAPAANSSPPTADAGTARAGAGQDAPPVGRSDGGPGSASAPPSLVLPPGPGRARAARDEAEQPAPVVLTGVPFQAMPAGVEVAADTLKGLAATLSGAAPHGHAGQPAVNQAPVPIAAVPVEIGMRALEGSQQFRLRLHPEDLGRIDVKLDIGKDGSVTAQLVVDRVETLAMLQRDARTLERAFDQAGLRTAENGLQFSLSSGAGQDQRQFRSQPDSPVPSIGPASSTKNELPEDLMAAVKRARSGPGGLDIRI